MSTQLGEAQIPIRATLDKLDSDLAAARGKVGSVIDGIVSNVQDVGIVALGIGGAAVGAIAGIGALLGKITIDAAPVEGLSNAFDGLAQSAGVGTDEMLAALKKGSAGMVSQRDLMMSFNQAAGLVSIDFAKQLPDAMGYLGKVSAATGQDMGFMLDSLVKGVGRLSPMILDNLGIQVSLAEATERASAMFGVEAGELTKTQTQAGMMNVVLEKLAANTAAMPDVTESAAAKMAQLKATFQDTKDQIGVAFLPVLTTVLGVLADVGERVLPILTGALETVAPIVATVAEAIGTFVGSILEGQDPLAALQELLGQLVPPEVAEKVMGIVESVRGFIAAAQEVLAPVMEWIGQNVRLEDVLIAIGIAIATVLIPLLWPIISTVLAVIATTAALIAVIALLRKAWESDFLGIRTALTEAWDTIKPALEALWEWLQTNIPAAIQTLKTFWEETLLPALTAAWEFIQTYLVPILEALGEVVGATLVLAATALAGLWENVLLPALKTAGAWISDTLGPILDKFIGWLTSVTGGLDGVKSALSSVKTWLDNVKTAISNIHLPSWLTPGSPTPFELGLVGIGEAARRLAQVELPRMAASLTLRSPQFAVVGAGLEQAMATPRGGGGTFTQNLYFGPESVRSEDDIYRLAELIERSLEMRGLQVVVG